MKLRTICIVTFTIGCSHAPQKLIDPPLDLRGRATTFASAMPCDTCPLFQFVLNLYPDSTYQWRKWAGSPAPHPDLSRVDHGRWRVSRTDNLLKLDGADEGEQALAILSSQLLETRAPDGSPTTWALSYGLNRQPSLDPFRVPFGIEGLIHFGSEVSTFTDCATKRKSIIAPTARLAQFRKAYLNQGLPPGRSLRVNIIGFYAPVPRLPGHPDTLFIDSVGSSSRGDQGFAWGNECFDPYPPFLLGGTRWRLYELLGQAVTSDRIAAVFTVDTLESSFAVSIGCARVVGLYDRRRASSPYFRPTEVETDRPGCNPAQNEASKALEKALAGAVHFRIVADILLLTDGDSIVARFVAAGRK